MNFGTLDDFAARLHEQMLLCSEGCVPLEDDFNRSALQLFGLQYEHNPAYRRFCAANKVSPSGLQQWQEIPAIPAASFKELELSCIPPGERTTVFFSSGTTGQQPSRHFHHERSLELYETSLLSWFAVHFPGGQRPEMLPIGSAGALPATFAQDHSSSGRELPCSSGLNESCARIHESRDPQAPRFVDHIRPLRMLSLTPPPAQAPHSSLIHMFETLRRSFLPPDFSFTGKTEADGTWTLNPTATLEFLRAAVDAAEPVVVLGTAFSFVHLLDWLDEHGQVLRLPAGSRVLETGGYKGRSRALPKPELHKLLTSRLGVPAHQIVCEYGMSELSSQAYDLVLRPLVKIVPDVSAPSGGAKSKRLFRFPPWVKVQVLSPETGREVVEGQTGLLRIFDLANVYSAMAIQTEDLAVRKEDGFELIGRAVAAEQRGCSLLAG